MTFTAKSVARRPALAVVACVAAIAAAAIGPPAAQARMEVAIQDETIFLHPPVLVPYSVPQAYAQAKALGVKWIRFNLIWGDYIASCQANGQAKCFQPWDDAVNRALANGVRVQITIAGTPAYEPGADSTLSFNRPSPLRFRNYAVLIARHFKGRVFRYSLWNEPNLPRWITPHNRAPRIYRTLVLAAYPAIKRVDRRIAVLIGEFTSANNPLLFMQQMGKGIKADGLAYHPFEFFTAPGSKIIRTQPRRVSGFIGINSTPWIQSTLKALARSRRISTPKGKPLPLHYTEFGYQSAGRYQLSESKRRVWALRAMQLVARFKVKEMLWYQLVHNPNSFGDVWDSGLIFQNGNPDPTYLNLQSHRRSYAGF